MGDFVSLKEVLEWMDSGRPFSLTAITCDERRKTGGELLQAEGAVKSGWLSASERKASLPVSTPRGARRNPNHYENSTRNILLPTGDIRKIHIRLIRKFNSQTVL